MARKGVLVTDGNQRATLAVARSLGAKGIPVIVGEQTRNSLAGCSKHCSHSFVYPSPWHDPEAYLSTVLEAAKRWEVAAIFPMTDLAMELIGARQDEIKEQFALPIPSLDQYHKLSDKVELARWAIDQQIPVPETHFISNGKIDDVIPELSAWPLVIKPGRSLIQKDGLWRKTAVVVANNEDDLRRHYHEQWYLQEPSMVQGFIGGYGEGVFGLFRSGEAQNLFAHRRLRECPPSGGVSALREAIPLNEPITSYAKRIVRAANWDGVAMVEFKVDEQTQIPYLMEVNGRFWGSLQLPIDAGVDFPSLLYKSIGEQNYSNASKQEADVQYKNGTRSQWWLGDLDHLLKRLRNSDLEANLHESAGSRWQAFVDLINVFSSGSKNEIFRLHDIVPGIFELKNYVRLKMNSLSEKLGYKAIRTQKTMRALAERRYLRSPRHRRKLQKNLPKKLQNILVLCKGNVCRSPFAEGYLREVKRLYDCDFHVSSSGLDAGGGVEAFPLAKTVSSRYDIDLQKHLTQPLTQDMVDAADLIFVMELEQKKSLVDRFSNADRKTFILGEFCEKTPMTDIFDPYGGSREDFLRCYDIIASSCHGFLSLVSGKPSIGFMRERAH